METQMTKINDLKQSVVQGRLDFFRSLAVCSPLPGAGFQSLGKDIYCYTSGIDNALCNGVLVHNEHSPSQDEIHTAKEHFNEHNLPFMWWTSAKSLEQQGFQFGGILGGVLVDISKEVSNDTSEPQITIRTVDSQADLKTFAGLAVEIFRMKPNSLEQFQAVITAAMNRREMQHFLAWVDGNPVGAVTLSTLGAVAGIWNLVTLPEYRRRGIATALARAGLLEAQRRQYGQVMAITMPKGMASGPFSLLGFKEVCRFPFYVYGVSPEERENY